MPPIGAEVIDLCDESPTVDDDCVIISPTTFGNKVGSNFGPPRPKKRRREEDAALTAVKAQQAADDEALARRLQREEQERASAASAQFARQLHAPRAGPYGVPRFARADEGVSPWHEEEEDEVPVWLRHNPFGLGGSGSASGGGGPNPHLAQGQSPSPRRGGARHRDRQRRRGSFDGLATLFGGGGGGFPLGGFGGLGGLRGNHQALMLAASDRDFGADDYEALLALDDNTATRGVSRQELEQHTSVTTLTSTPSEEMQCSVCLEPQEQGNTVRRLPCLHGFHKDCIDQWLKKSQVCPICKLKVNGPGGGAGAGGGEAAGAAGGARGEGSSRRGEAR